MKTQVQMWEDLKAEFAIQGEWNHKVYGMAKYGHYEIFVDGVRKEISVEDGKKLIAAANQIHLQSKINGAIVECEKRISNYRESQSPIAEKMIAIYTFRIALLNEANPAEIEELRKIDPSIFDRSF